MFQYKNKAFPKTVSSKNTTDNICIIIQGVEKRAMMSDLYIKNITYGDEGEYVCEAVNVIGGEQRIVRSQIVKVYIFPRFLLINSKIFGAETEYFVQ